VKAWPVEPTEVELPYARSLIVVDKTVTTSGGETVRSRHIYISSLPCRKGCAERFARLIRGHWGGCENRNHWVRDHVFGEDKTRSKNWHLNANLSLLRMAALRVRAELMPDLPWIQLAEKAQYKTAFVYQPVVNHRSK
jgi:predicted transposase YbfD/YdcC